MTENYLRHFKPFGIAFLISLLIGLLFYNCSRIVNKSIQTEEWYICTPCGESCDTMLFNAPGVCPHCKKELVEKPILDEYNRSLEVTAKDIGRFWTPPRPAATFGQFRSLDDRKVDAAQFAIFLRAMVDSLEVPAISIGIINGNETVFYYNYGVKDFKEASKIDENTLFEAASLTKPFFAYIVLELAAAGKIQLDKPLYEYYPHPDLLNDPRHKLITARMVLSHHTGLPNWRSDALRFEAEPGAEFIYSGEGFEYLGLVLEKIMNKDLNAILYEKGISKFGMSPSTLIESPDTKYNMANGHRNGEVSGRQLSFKAHPAYSLRTNGKEFSKFLIGLSKSSVFETMTTPQYKLEPEKSVCLGIFERETPFGKKYYHTGNNGNRFTSRFELYPDKKFGFVFLTNCDKEEELSIGILKYLSGQ